MTSELFATVSPVPRPGRGRSTSLAARSLRLDRAPTGALSGTGESEPYCGTPKTCSTKKCYVMRLVIIGMYGRRPSFYTIET